MVDITGLDKAAVLAALFNGAGSPMHGHPMTPAAIVRSLHPGGMSLEDAAELVKQATQERGSRTSIYFDYVRGRPLKVELAGDSLDPRLYDRDHGDGAAAQAIARLRGEKAA